MAQPPPKFTGTGLEEVNIPGQAYLREALTSCTDPLKAIESFQVLKSINILKKSENIYIFLNLLS